VRFIGIDPGKSGAIAVLDGYGEIVSIYDMPVVGNQVSGTLLCDMIDDADESGPGPLAIDVVCVIEQVHSMPKQGVASSFDFGKSYGIVLGVLAGARVHTEHVTPQRWKKAMRLTADKEMCRRRAIERWPRQADLFKRKKDADRAEAALMALWFIEQGAA
jgi:crossover junction endodeoxyribonuclease RuvC